MNGKVKPDKAARLLEQLSSLMGWWQIVLCSDDSGELIGATIGKHGFEEETTDVNCMIYVPLTSTELQ